MAPPGECDSWPRALIFTFSPTVFQAANPLHGSSRWRWISALLLSLHLIINEGVPPPPPAPSTAPAIWSDNPPPPPPPTTPSGQQAVITMARHRPSSFSNAAEKWVYDECKGSILLVKFQPALHAVKEKLDSLARIRKLDRRKEEGCSKTLLIKEEEEEEEEEDRVKKDELSQLVESATPFVVAENDGILYLLTCAHVLKHLYTVKYPLSAEEINHMFRADVICDHQEKSFRNGLRKKRNYAKATVARVDCKKDLLLRRVHQRDLLDLDGPCKFPHNPLVASQYLPDPLESVVIVAWPPYMNRATSMGELSHQSRSYADASFGNEFGYNMDLIEANIFVANGCSGAPLLNCDAKYIGLLHASGSGCYSCFVSLSDIIRRLTDWKVLPEERHKRARVEN